MASDTTYRCSLCGDGFGDTKSADGYLAGIKWSPGDVLTITPALRDNPHHICVKCGSAIYSQWAKHVAAYPMKEKAR